MFDFSPYVNLPLIWGAIISLAILLYILLDGFDLGVGILFPFAPDDEARTEMMESIAPFWDGNETWLVLGGGGLFAAFPLAYSVLCPAFYIPITLMLLGLIFRGVAFEFRLKANGRFKTFWDYAFHFGSIVAALCQGSILGSFIQGIKLTNGVFDGDSFDFVTPFSITTAIALVFGYASLGGTWLIMKADNKLQIWARKTTIYLFIYVALFALITSIWLNYLCPNKLYNNMNYVIIIALLTIFTLFLLCKSVMQSKEVQPFVYCIVFLILNFLGMSLHSWPFIVPYTIKFSEAASAGSSLSLMLVGVAIFLPIIIIYTIYSYYIFRGKSSKDVMYNIEH